MSKKNIIIISVFSAVLLLLIILFAAVFCLRVQTVKIVDGSILQAENADILSTAGLKNGQSIFGIDKAGAINRIEKKYPYIKVVQIKTTGVNSIEICVRAREAMYYLEHNGTYNILDEDLKVLNQTSNFSYITERYKSLINFSSHKNNNQLENDLGITNNTKPCDFVGNDFYKNVAYNLFVSMRKTVDIIDEDGNKHEAQRADIRALLSKIEFGTGNTLKEEYRTLILTTTTGVKITIAKPQVDMQHKINVCFSTYNILTEQQKKEGYIKYLLDKDGKVIIGYYQTNS